MHPLKIFAVLLLVGGTAFPVPPDPVTLLRSIDLPGVEGRIDHLAVDTAAPRLFVAALGNNTVEVIDLRSGVHLKSLAGFREPQGIAIVPEAHLVVIANGQGDGAQTIDAKDFHVVKSVSLGDDADNVRYDAAAKLVYVGYGSGALAAVNPESGAAVSTVKLAGHPESFQLERSGPRIFVNVPTAGHVAVVDRRAMKVTATWPVTDARSNFPMALDEANHRLFIGCRRPATLLVYDTERGTVLGRTDIVGDTDDLFYDARRKRVYVFGGEGFLDVVDASDPAKPVRLTRIATAAGARTGQFAPDLSQLYLAVPHRGAQHAAIRVYDVRD
jgi:DNA-binding beta-propeller fold protein YncE